MKGIIHEPRLAKTNDETRKPGRRETGWTAGEENDPTQRKIDAYFLKNVMEEGDREQSGSSSSRLGDPSHHAARRGSRTKFT